MLGAECGDRKFPGGHGLWKASSSRMEKQILGGNTPDPGWPLRLLRWKTLDLTPLLLDAFSMLAGAWTASSTWGWVGKDSHCSWGHPLTGGPLSSGSKHRGLTTWPFAGSPLPPATTPSDHKGRRALDGRSTGDQTDMVSSGFTLF